MSHQRVPGLHKTTDGADLLLNPSKVFSAQTQAVSSMYASPPRSSALKATSFSGLLLWQAVFYICATVQKQEKFGDLNISTIAFAVCYPSASPYKTYINHCFLFKDFFLEEKKVWEILQHSPAAVNALLEPVLVLTLHHRPLMAPDPWKIYNQGPSPSTHQDDKWIRCLCCYLPSYWTTKKIKKGREEGGRIQLN